MAQLATEALPDAAADASVAVVEALLARGADPRATDPDGVSALPKRSGRAGSIPQHSYAASGPSTTAPTLTGSWVPAWPPTGAARSCSSRRARTCRTALATRTGPWLSTPAARDPRKHRGHAGLRLLHR